LLTSVTCRIDLHLRPILPFKNAGRIALDSLLAVRLPIERRFAAIGILLALEALLIFVHVRDTERSVIARWGYACASIFVAFGYPRLRHAIEDAADLVEREPLSLRFLATHVMQSRFFCFLVHRGL